MRTEEKARLLVGMGMRMPGGPPPTQTASASSTVPQTASAVAPASQGPVVGSTQSKVPGAAGTTADFAQFGIPTIVVADGPAGLRISPTRPNDTKTYYATAFPIATLLASTWDTDLVRKTGEAMGNEVKEYGVDILLGPGMNSQRNPLGGRDFEYYSEDPLLTGKMASAMVQGIQSNGVGVSIKHFAANNHETNRNRLNVKVSERALREIYLKGFEICVKEADPWTIMSSYNKINGTYTSQSADLLRKILRTDWHYTGFVMTDWFGGDNPVEQMKAGNDLLMPGSPKQLSDIIEAVKTDKLAEPILDGNVEAMLNIIKKTPSFNGYKFSNQPDLKAHGNVARRVAAEGIILLKNDKRALPLAKNQKIAAFGNYTYDLISGGTGSGDVNEAYTVSLPEGLQKAGFTLDETLKTGYEAYLKAEKDKQPKQRSFFDPAISIPEMALSNEAIAAATTADLAIITIGRVSGEFADRKQTDYYLTTAEKDLIQNVSAAFHAKGKKVIVLLNIGGPIDVASWRDKVDTILLPWLPGQEAGNAIADVLTGIVNPSGKLARTFSVTYDDEPAAAGFPGKEYGEPVGTGPRSGRYSEIDYLEGVYVGYRGFDKKSVAPAYEFGYGLSYTTFTYSGLTLSSPAFTNKLTVSVTVKNTGAVAGKEVVQLYLSAPAKTMDKPTQELRGFAKTKLLKPNESQTLTFDLNARDLASFDEKTTSWVAEAGIYTVNIGSSSRHSKVKGNFNLPKTMAVEKVTKELIMQ